MKKLGRVVHITGQGKILLRGKLQEDYRGDPIRAVSIGSTVVTKRMEEIGSVYDLFGPVKQPYISIKPITGLSEREIQKLRDEWVYLS
ncbi:MAG: Gar1/Naf1 family protein [Halobacteriota archaeon]|nr:Gar1/Naf1 family protein [Halobacteriota archaeon]